MKNPLRFVVSRPHTKKSFCISVNPSFCQYFSLVNLFSTIALDLLSIPLMSAKCAGERVFSSAKTLVTDRERRHRMKADIIEACTILRHYYKENAEE